jgi:hypothetical protein
MLGGAVGKSYIFDASDRRLGASVHTSQCLSRKAPQGHKAWVFLRSCAEAQVWAGRPGLPGRRQDHRAWHCVRLLLPAPATGQDRLLLRGHTSRAGALA